MTSETCHLRMTGVNKAFFGPKGSAAGGSSSATGPTSRILQKRPEFLAKSMRNEKSVTSSHSLQMGMVSRKANVATKSARATLKITRPSPQPGHFSIRAILITA